MKYEKPNILVILTDQQRTDSLGCYRSAFNHTPHIDRLASEGVLFERAYCANPVSTPARASIFSGRYPSRHGAWSTGMNVPESEVLLSHRLAAFGYRTHYVGKAHFQAFGGKAKESVETQHQWEKRYPAWKGPYYGFETVELALGHVTYGLAGHYGAWVRSQVGEAEFEKLHGATRLSQYEFGGDAYDWQMPLKFHNSVWTAERTIDFLKKQKGKRPFLLAVGFQDPHHPHALPMDFRHHADADDVPLPDYAEGELEDKPPHFMEARCGKLEQSRIRGRFPVAGQGPGADFRRVSEHDARQGRAYYYAMVRLIDEQVGRILDSLDEQNLSANTLMIFTTDHGELLGDHGLWMKGPFHYEQLIRIPLIVRWPRKIEGRRRIKALFSQVDIVPTLLGAIGQSTGEEVDGKNGMALLAGKDLSIRDWLLVECVDDPHGLRLKTVVTRRRKLTWYCGRRYGELYDLEKDPREKVNLWEDPAYGADRAKMLAMILTDQEALENRAPRYGYA